MTVNASVTYVLPPDDTGKDEQEVREIVIVSSEDDRAMVSNLRYRHRRSSPGHAIFEVRRRPREKTSVTRRRRSIRRVLCRLGRE